MVSLLEAGWLTRAASQLGPRVQVPCGHGCSGTQLAQAIGGIATWLHLGA